MPHLFGGPKMYLHLFDGSQHLFAFIWVLRGSKIIYLHSIIIYLMVPNIYLHLLHLFGGFFLISTLTHSCSHDLLLFCELQGNSV